MSNRFMSQMDCFLIENDTLTPTFKIKWGGPAAKYQEEPNTLYVLGEPQTVNSVKL